MSASAATDLTNLLKQMHEIGLTRSDGAVLADRKR